MYRQNRFPGGLTIVAAGVPALMTLAGHPVLGAATMGVVLLAWVAHARTASQPRPADQLHPASERPAAVIEDFDPDDDERPWVYLRATDW